MTGNRQCAGSIRLGNARGNGASVGQCVARTYDNCALASQRASVGESTRFGEGGAGADLNGSGVAGQSWNGNVAAFDRDAAGVGEGNPVMKWRRSTGGLCEGASVVDNAGTTCPASNLRIALQIDRAATLVSKNTSLVEQCTAGLGPVDGATVDQFTA